MKPFYSYGGLKDKDNQYDLIGHLLKKFGKIVFEIRLRGKELSIYLRVNKDSDEHREFVDYCISIEGDFVNYEIGTFDVPSVMWEFD